MSSTTHVFRILFDISNNSYRVTRKSGAQERLQGSETGASGASRFRKDS